MFIVFLSSPSSTEFKQYTQFCYIPSWAETQWLAQDQANQPSFMAEWGIRITNPKANRFVLLELMFFLWVFGSLKKYSDKASFLRVLDLKVDIIQMMVV